MLGGILSYGIGQIKTFPVWKAIFLLCGGVTVLWGIILFFFLPDDIITAKRFTLEEKATLIARGKVGRTGILNRSIKTYQIKEALMDPQVWLLTLFTLLNEAINGGVRSQTFLGKEAESIADSLTPARLPTLANSSSKGWSKILSAQPPSGSRKAPSKSSGY